MREVIDLLKREKWLTTLGSLGLLLGFICQGYIIFFGAEIGTEGDLSKAVSFNIALGIFLLTTALIISFAQLPRRLHRLFQWAYSLAAIYSYGLETIQHFRGIDPRFTTVGSTLDQILGAVFGLVAITMVLFYFILALYFFRKGALKTDRTGLIVGIRYGLITTMLGFAAGIWISSIQSRYTGDSGNIIWLHGLGFHGIQAVPLIAWLLEKQSEYKGKLLIHVGGISWALTIVCIGIQTLLGLPIFELTVFPVLSILFFVSWFIVMSMVMSHVIVQRVKRSQIDSSVKKF